MHKVLEIHFHTFNVGGKRLWRWGWDRVTPRLFAVDLGPFGIAWKLVDK